MRESGRGENQEQELHRTSTLYMNTQECEVEDAESCGKKRIRSGGTALRQSAARSKERHYLLMSWPLPAA